MKINKQQLKTLIKECLIEILIDGHKSTQNIQQNKVVESTIVTQQSTTPTAKKDIMLEMLEHTAATTYREQIEADRKQMTNERQLEAQVEKIKNEVPIEQTPQTQLWQTLAFMEQPRKR